MDLLYGKQAEEEKRKTSESYNSEDLVEIDL